MAKRAFYMKYFVLKLDDRIDVKMLCARLSNYVGYPTIRDSLR